MKYRHFVTAPSGAPSTAATAAYGTTSPVVAPVFGSGDGHGSRPPAVEPSRGYGAVAPRFGDATTVFRMPPVVQFLANVDPGLARYLTSVALQTHLRGGDGRAICDELYAMAMRLGYSAVLNHQDVQAAGMPSHPGQHVVTAFIMMDLQAL